MFRLLQRLANSLKKRLFNLSLRDNFNFLSKERQRHFEFNKILKNNYPLNIKMELIANYAIPESLLSSLMPNDLILSGGVEFHIEFEEELNKLKNLEFHFFEVDPRSMSWFKHKFKHNNNFKLNEFGLADKNGNFDIYGDPNASWSSSISEEITTKNPLNWQKIGVAKTVKLSDYCRTNNIDSIALLKLDIEGYASKVIQDIWMNDILPKCIVFELERAVKGKFEDFKTDVQHLISLSKEKGYSTYFLPREDSVSSFSSQFVFYKQ